MENRKGERATPQEEEKLDLVSRLSYRGLIVVIDPLKKIYEYYRPDQLGYPPDVSFVNIYNKDGTVKRSLLRHEYGKVWFVTKKEADQYCNRVIQGDVL